MNCYETSFAGSIDVGSYRSDGIHAPFSLLLIAKAHGVASIGKRETRTMPAATARNMPISRRITAEGAIADTEKQVIKKLVVFSGRVKRLAVSGFYRVRIPKPPRLTDHAHIEPILYRPVFIAHRVFESRIQHRSESEGIAIYFTSKGAVPQVGGQDIVA